MPVREWSRRDILRECLAGGLLLVPAGWNESDALAAWLGPQGTRQPTPHVEMGPFYKKRAPANPMLRAAGDAGLPLSISGRVISVSGDAVPEAKIEVWQANHAGLYDLEGYRYRATIAAPPGGAYVFESVMPGHYPARVARHVHYFVTAPGFKPLSTQLYFSTDEAFEGNPDRNYSKDPLVTSRSLVRPVMLSGEPGAPSAAVEFELVMEKTR